MGYTQGSGSFHVPEELYKEMLVLLSNNGVDVARGYGHGPSRKLKLISLGFRYLGLKSFEYHGIKREFYLFSFADNLREVIQYGKRPVWIDRPFYKLVDYWKKRWAIPRAKRKREWESFTVNRFFSKIDKMLKQLEIK